MCTPNYQKIIFPSFTIEAFCQISPQQFPGNSNFLALRFLNLLVACHLLNKKQQKNPLGPDWEKTGDTTSSL